MQWDDTTHAGFSTSKPWIDVHDDYQTWNAAAQVTDKNSVYHYWSRVLQLRKTHPEIFVYGSFDLVSPEHPDVFAYTRTADAGRSLVVVNFRPKEVIWTVPENLRECFSGGQLLLSNYGRHEAAAGEQKEVILRPLEAFVRLG